MSANSAAAKAALSLKGSMFPLTVLDLPSADLTDLSETLHQKIAVAPDFFHGTAIVADCSMIAESIDFTALKQIVDSQGLYLVGLSGLSDEQAAEAKAINLPRFKQIGKKRQYQDADLANTPHIQNLDKSPKPQPVAQPPQEQPASNAQAPNAEVQIVEKEVVRVIETDYKPPKIFEGTVRGGQRLYAEDRDLIIIGNVSHGAEVIADGNIHIYGSLRGRALAGAQGNTESIICVSHIEAQLVSIAGYYKVLEDVKEYTSMGTIRVTLADTSLKFNKI